LLHHRHRPAGRRRDRGGHPASLRRRDVTDTAEQAGPLAGLRVIDLSTTLPGAQATQFLADAGADVILVEGAEGSPLRADPGWPGLLRGKRSVILDLHADDGRPT